MTTVSPVQSPVCSCTEGLPAERPEALFTAANYFGTLAAARSLGRSGIPVVIADRRRLTPARWSRRVAYTVSCPEVDTEPVEFLEWLLALGARRPGRVLYATSDALAWMYALHRDVLARDFRVYVPAFEAVYTLLNKWRLHRACIALNIDVPETCILHEDRLARVAREARYPLVMKPQTQAFFFPPQKGRVVRSADSLVRVYREFREATGYSPIAIEQDRQVSVPLVQAFVDCAAAGVYSLSGFVDETGELFVAAASRKVLQRPRRLGVGLCFEEVEVEPKLAADVAKICRHVGYYGAFEVEFLDAGGRFQLIDFNPRFYGQMGFDVARGLDLPLLVYLASVGAHEELRRQVQEARQTVRQPAWRVYCNRIELEAALLFSRLAGRIEDDGRWRGWLSRNRGRLTDAVLDRDDWLPGAVQTVAAVLHRAAHPRSTWRQAQED
jgi:predicted ATP-grasp superfamily ATP-dependent carboligase